MEAGGWKLEVGGWRLEAGGWRLRVSSRILNPQSSILNPQSPIPNPENSASRCEKYPSSCFTFFDRCPRPEYTFSKINGNSGGERRIGSTVCLDQVDSECTNGVGQRVARPERPPAGGDGFGVDFPHHHRRFGNGPSSRFGLLARWAVGNGALVGNLRGRSGVHRRVLAFAAIGETTR